MTDKASKETKEEAHVQSPPEEKKAAAEEVKQKKEAPKEPAAFTGAVKT